MLDTRFSSLDTRFSLLDDTDLVPPLKRACPATAGGIKGVVCSPGLNISNHLLNH